MDKEEECQIKSPPKQSRFGGPVHCGTILIYFSLKLLLSKILLALAAIKLENSCPFSSG